MASTRTYLAASFIATTVLVGIGWARVYDLAVRPLLQEYAVRLAKLMSNPVFSAPWLHAFLSIILDVLAIAVAVLATLWIIARFVVEASEAGKWRTYYRSLEAKRDQWLQWLTAGQVLQYVAFMVLVVGLYFTSFALHFGLWERSILLQLHLLLGVALAVLVIGHVAYYGLKALRAVAAKLHVEAELPMLAALSRPLRLFNPFQLLVNPYARSKYDAGQVFEYWATLVTTIVAGIAGLVLAFYGPSALNGIAWLVHVKTTTILVTVVLMMHICYDHFRPTTFPLDISFLTGKIPAKRAKEEGYTVKQLAAATS